MNIRAVLGLAVLSLAGVASAQGARDYIYVVGSSTVYPFSTVVAETFGQKTDHKTPKIESTGSGGGLKLFCAGIGVQHPDITNASRRIKASEVVSCAANNVHHIIEVKIGYDGIVLANSRKSEPLQLSLRDIYLALAAQVPNAEGEGLIENPFTTWQEVNADLPAMKIEVLGPPPTSGTRDAFVELAMEGGCKTFPKIKALKKTDKPRYKALCHTLREDGHYIEAGENDNLIVSKLQENPAALGIFGFSFLDQNTDKVHGARVNGFAPSFDAIADGQYPISRLLYFYAKSAHVDVIPGMRAFLAEFTSDAAMGEEGYLSDRGLIPMPEHERAEVVAAVAELIPLKLAAE